MQSTADRECDGPCEVALVEAVAPTEWQPYKDAIDTAMRGRGQPG